MAWSGGAFTRANGANEWVTDYNNGVGIEPARHDAQDNDLATGINQCLNKDGSNAATGNLNLGGNIPTNIGAGTAAAPALCMNNDTNTGFFSAAADQIGVATNGAERIRIDATGNVGLGTTTPGANIDIQTTTGNMTITRFSADTTTSAITLRKNRNATVGGNTIVNSGDEIGAIGFQASNGTTYTPAAAIYALVDGTPGATNDMPGRLAFYTTQDGNGAFTERMRIDNSGKVGIGGAPTWNFDLIGNNNGDFISRIYNANSGASGNAQILFGNNTSDAAIGLRLNSSANAGLGGANSFNIYQGLAAPICLFTAGTVRQTIASNGIHTMHAYGAGTATFSAAGVISSVSDERLKVKDGSITDPLTKIEALQPGYWRWKDEMQDELGSQRELGFFAQNVNAAIGEEAAPVPEEGKRWGYYDRSVLAVAVEAIKELHAKVKTLEAKVAALES